MVRLPSLLAHTDKDRLDPMNVDQWRFYVLSREEVERYPRSQYSIGLQSLERYGARCVSYAELRAAVESLKKVG